MFLRSIAITGSKKTYYSYLLWYPFCSNGRVIETILVMNQENNKSIVVSDKRFWLVVALIAVFLFILFTTFPN